MGSKNLIRIGDVGVFAAVVMGVLLAISALHFHSTRLEREVVDSHQRLVEIEARHVLDHVVQTLDAVNIALQSLPAPDQLLAAASPANAVLERALQHQPHLRSLSLVGLDGEIVASSNPGNVGLRADLSGYLPGADAPSDLLRIGSAHAGRDLNDGRLIIDRSEYIAAMEFFPVLREITTEGVNQYRLLAAINVDYFLNHLTSHPPFGLERVEILRYDGSPLFSTSALPHSAAALEANADIAAQWRSGTIAGKANESIAGEGDYITSWRVARILPLVVISRLDRASVLADARAESRKQQLVLFPLMFMVMTSLLTLYLMFRRANHRFLRLKDEESRRLSRLLDALPANVLLFAEDGRAQVTNLSWQRFASRHEFPINAESQPLHYRTLGDWLAPRISGTEKSIGLAEGIEAVLQGKWKAFDGEFSFDTEPGQRWLHIMVRPFTRDHARGVAMLQLDITDRRLAEEGMEMLDAALNATANAIVITDTNAVIEWANPAFARLTGFSQSEAIGRMPKELISSGKQDTRFYADMWQTILGGKVWRGELVNKHKSGALYHESLTITPVLDRDGKPKHFVAVKEDVTQRKEQESELRLQATTDPLTGAMNRRAIIDNVTLELERVKRHGRNSCFMMLDLDHFKRVNDEHGHAVGDVVLKHFCTLATAALRKIDMLGRIGGEEFGILLTETTLEGAIELAERLRLALEASPVRVDDIPIPITVSIGVALIAPGDQGPDQVLARADQALYLAKTNGRNRVEPRMDAPVLPS